LIVLIALVLVVFSNLRLWIDSWVVFFNLNPQHQTGYANLTLLWLFWFAVFVPLQRLFRQRLVRRERPLWWARLPGLFALFSFTLVSTAGVLVFMGHEDEFLKVSTFLSAILIAPSALCISLLIWLIFECLRPDRVIDDPKVFE